MLQEEQKLIKKAEEKHGKINPVRGRGKHDKRSFTRDKKNRLLFWFNTPDGSTHIIK